MITIIIGGAGSGKSLIARGLKCFLDDNSGEIVRTLHEGGTSKQIKELAPKSDHLIICMQDEPSSDVLALSHRIIRIERGPAK